MYQRLEINRVLNWSRNRGWRSVEVALSMELMLKVRRSKLSNGTEAGREQMAH